MGGLLASLLNSASSLAVYNKAFSTISNNISNANTPGYAEQTLALVAMPFNPTEGISGGVMSEGLVSSRSEYLEQNVRNQQTLLGDAQQRASDLGQIQPLVNPNSTSGIASSLSTFFNSFSQLSVNPNDPSSRQAVLAAAWQVAQSFNEAATGFGQIASGVESQTSSTVSQINQLTSQIASLNGQFQGDVASQQDAGLDAQMHNDLENLSTLVNFSMVKSNDGAYNVYLGGQTPLVVGDRQSQISADFSSGQTEILDAQSNDVTSQINGGSLGAMIQENNTTLPGYMTQLNTLAQTFADQVNGQLSQGLDASGAAPSTNLFSYSPSGTGQSSNVAASLAVTNLTQDQIAAASAGAPGGNGNALAVAQLANAALINGSNFTQAFGDLSAQVGSDVADAQQHQTEDQDLVTQAQQQRQDVSGVSLDAEAAKLLQFQQSYQAAGQLVTVLNSLTQTLLNIIPVGSS